MSEGRHRSALVELAADVNERIHELASVDSGRSEAWEFCCECGRPLCWERIRLSLAEYEELRRAGERVLVAGH